MPQGIVLRRQAGFYYVEETQREVDGLSTDMTIITDVIYECKVRGRIKKDGIDILVGDRVDFTVLSESSGVIEDVSPRLNVLVRPPIANIDQVLVVFAIKDPDPVWQLLDRILVSAESIGIGAVICFTKSDLVSDDQMTQAVNTYEAAGYRVLSVSAKEELGLGIVQSALINKITCLTGPSGAGKSSLINALDASLRLQTGELSEKTQRGKHTTRHVELLPLPFGGLIADTPGFSKLSIEVTTNDLAGLFPEFDRLAGDCRFRGCVHVNEPDCAVKQAVENNSIARSRYDSYILLMREIASERRY